MNTSQSSQHKCIYVKRPTAQEVSLFLLNNFWDEHFSLGRVYFIQYLIYEKLYNAVAVSTKSGSCYKSVYVDLEHFKKYFKILQP